MAETVYFEQRWRLPLTKQLQHASLLLLALFLIPAISFLISLPVLLHQPLLPFAVGFLSVFLFAHLCLAAPSYLRALFSGHFFLRVRADALETTCSQSHLTYWRNLIQARRLDFEPAWSAGPWAHLLFDLRHLSSGPLILLDSGPTDGSCVWYALRLNSAYRSTKLFPFEPLFISRRGIYFYLRVEKRKIRAFETALKKAGGKEKVGSALRNGQAYARWIGSYYVSRI